MLAYFSFATLFHLAIRSIVAHFGVEGVLFSVGCVRSLAYCRGQGQGGHDLFGFRACAHDVRFFCCVLAHCMQKAQGFHAFAPLVLMFLSRLLRGLRSTSASRCWSHLPSLAAPADGTPTLLKLHRPTLPHYRLLYLHPASFARLVFLAEGFRPAGEVSSTNLVQHLTSFNSNLLILWFFA